MIFVFRPNRIVVCDGQPRPLARWTGLGPDVSVKIRASFYILLTLKFR